MTFTAETKLPLASISFLSRLKERYSCGPMLDFTAAQVALLDAYDNLYPVQKLRAMHGAVKDGRDHITGADVLAFTPRKS